MGTMRTKLGKLAAIGTIGLIGALGAVSDAGAAASGTTGPHAGGTVACIAQGGTFGNGVNLKAFAPVVKAYNYTTGVDRQTVTMQPVVMRWNGSAWVEAVYGEVLKGTATDTASPTTWYHNTTNANWASGEEDFKLPPGYFAIAYKLNWFYSSPVSGNPATLSGSDYVWATGYSLQSPVGGPVPAISYCTT